MTTRTPPLTPEQWAIARLFREKLGLTYAEVGAVIGKSASMVKVGLKGYVQYRTPSGGWSIKKPGGEDPAHPVEGAVQGGED